MNKIIITLSLDNETGFGKGVNIAKKAISEYFGIKNFVDNPDYPACDVTCEVTQTDIDYLKSMIPQDVQLMVIVGNIEEHLSKNFLYLDKI